MGSKLSFPHLVVEHLECRGVRVIALSGELGLSSLGELRGGLDAVSALAQPQVCLDLAELQFIDSSGLAALSRLHLMIAEADGALAIVCVPGAVHRTMKMAGLLEMLIVYDSRAAAIEALAPAA